MKKILPLFVFMALLFPAVSFAQDVIPVMPNTPVRTVSDPATQGKTPTMATLNNPLKVASLDALYKSIINIIVEIGYVVVGFFILLSGFKFVTAQGNPKAIEDAKKTFYGTIIGAIIVVGAQTIFAVLQNVVSSLNK